MATVEIALLFRILEEALSNSDLLLRTDGSRNDNATVIYGVAAHDLYHAGQIQLIKRLLPGGA